MSEHRTGGPDLRTTVGSVELPNPVMTASGTSGHGAELAPYVDLAALGAVVVKSLSVEPWAGNPPLRVHEATAGMLNSVGLQGPGIAAWCRDDLPALLATGARVVASIWGRTVADYAAAAAALADAPPEVVAVEVNLSCPNTEAARDLFAHSAEATAAAMSATARVPTTAVGQAQPQRHRPGADRPRRARRRRGGGHAGQHRDGHGHRSRARAPTGSDRGRGGGGLSGPAIHPVAVRAVHDVHAALPDLPIVGVGGVTDGDTAAELVLAGASAVQVGTATFADPRAPRLVLDGLRELGRGHRPSTDP